MNETSSDSDKPTPVVDAAEGVANQPASISLFRADGNMRRLKDIEDDILRIAWAHYSGNLSAIAQYLGVSRSKLYRLRQDGALEFVQSTDDDSVDSGRPVTMLSNITGASGYVELITAGIQAKRIEVLSLEMK